MQRASTLPLTALLAVGLITALTSSGILPPGMTLLEQMQQGMGNYFFALIFLIILLESIVYVGFYFPGQFFAVVLVVLSQPDTGDIVGLTLAMVVAATLGSAINFTLGRRVSDGVSNNQRPPLKHLLLAMIHINSLAFFMFNQGASGRPARIIWLAAILNLPYYLLLTIGTAVLDEEVMTLAENTWLLASLILIWLMIAIYLDVKKNRLWRRRQPRQQSRHAALEGVNS